MSLWIEKWVTVMDGPNAKNAKTSTVATSHQTRDHGRSCIPDADAIEFR